MMKPRKPDVDRQCHGQHELVHGHGSRNPFHRQCFFHQLLESQLLQHRHHWQESTIGRQILSFEVVGCGSPDFIGLRDNCFSCLFGGSFVAMLFSVDHHLGDSRESAREVWASRLFCFTPGFSGSPNGCHFRRAGNAQFLCISQLTSTTPHLGNPFFSNPTKLDFEPRVGLAWDPFSKGKTSIRIGFGIFDNLPLPYLFGAAMLLSAPFFELGDDTTLPQGSFPNRAFSLLSTPTLRYAYIQPNPPRSYDMEWNFNIQQNIAPDTVLQLGYTGSRRVHLPYFTNNFDMVLPTVTPQGYVWPVNGTPLNPNVGQISGTLWNSDSIFHALEVQVTRRLSKGLQAGVSYTWGKIIDSGSESQTSNPGTFVNSVPTLWFDEKYGRGLADFDIRQNLTVNYIWKIPSLKAGPRALQRALNSWQWGGILHVASGEPFTPIITGDPLGMKGDQFDRPDVLTGPGCSGSLVNAGNPLDYIKTQCFAFPNPSTRFGDAGRNILIGPGFVNLDTSLFRNIGNLEKLHTQFRAEFFNVLNHTNFAAPVVPTNNTSLFAANGAPISSAGVLTSTTTTSRQIQFALKLVTAFGRS